jgi:putative oxidoreductase
MDIGLLILRVAVGALFIGHGTQKLFGWFGGHGLKGTGQFLESQGYRPGAFMALVAGLAETGGGVLLLTGFLTPLGAAAVIGVMINAIISVKLSQGVLNGYELDLTYASVAAALGFIGAGAYSVDSAVGWDLSGAVWGLGALALGIATAGLVLLTRRVERPVAIHEAERRAA